MNIHRYFIGSAASCGIPSFKQSGLEAGIFGPILGWTTDTMNMAMNEANNFNNWLIAAQNNQTSVDIARENNALQQRMLEQNLAWSSQEAEKAYQRELEKIKQERDYNTPLEQVKRLRAAGLNPALAFGGQNTSAASGATAPQAQGMGSGISPSMPSFTSPHMNAFRFSNPSQSFAEMAQGFAALAAAKKEGVETTQLERTMDDYVKKFASETNMQLLSEKYYSLFEGEKRSLELSKLKQEIGLDTQKIQNLIVEGDFIAAQAALVRQKELTEQKITELRHYDVEMLKKKYEVYWEYLQAEIKQMIASANQSNASARLTSEQAIQLRDMRDYNEDIRRNESQLSTAELQKVGATLYQEIEYMLNNFEFLSESQRYQLQQVKASADMAKWKYDMRWVDFALDTAERINNGITNWIPFAPDKTTTVDSNSGYDASFRHDARGNIRYSDTRQTSNDNTHTVIREKKMPWQM